MAFSTSAAIALESATLSWLARDSLRTRRPYHMAGRTTRHTTSNTCTITVGWLQTSIVSAPSPITALRKPIDSEEPTTVCTSVVSVVRRESTSPVWVVSKNCGL